MPALVVGLLAVAAMNEVRSGETPAYLGLSSAAVHPSGSPALTKLGRRVFFDTRLSRNGLVSCATCHQPERAFSDGQTLATGVNGHKGTRNTPSLINAVLHDKQFWDGRRSSLEEQVLDPFVNPAEHGLPDHARLLELLHRDESYRKDFAGAFPAALNAIALPLVAKALSGFIRSLAAGGSAFDRHEYGKEPAALDEPARRGLALFRGRAQCAECHVIGARDAPLTDNQFHNISVGLERIASKLPILARKVAQTKKEQIDTLVISDPGIAALGRFVVTKNPSDIGKFRTPTLRNVALTAPYMHDGSVATLEHAVDHELYYRGQALGRPLILTPAERSDLVAFLRALTSGELPR
ncbi:MAG: cytochrome-c peroxidase [Burkholderiales bacterium]